MNEEIYRMPDKASRAIRAAELRVDAGDPEFASGRAYYGKLYAALALLNEEGVRFHKHGSVHAAFGQRFAKTRRLDPKYHRWLLDAFDKRMAGDYEFADAPSPEQARSMINQAREFLQVAREYLGRQP
jgi:uncharacterized protein (UPF0332 family)